MAAKFQLIMSNFFSALYQAAAASHYTPKDTPITDPSTSFLHLFQPLRLHCGQRLNWICVNMIKQLFWHINATFSTVLMQL